MVPGAHMGQEIVLATTSQAGLVIIPGAIGKNTQEGPVSEVGIFCPRQTYLKKHTSKIRKDQKFLQVT